MWAVSLIGGVILGLLGGLVRDWIRTPRLILDECARGPYYIATTFERIKHSNGPTGWHEAHANSYRIRVRNRHLPLIHAAAEDCVALLDLDGCPEAYQLRWIPAAPRMSSINVDDWVEFDLCAVVHFVPTRGAIGMLDPRRMRKGPVLHRHHL